MKTTRMNIRTQPACAVRTVVAVAIAGFHLMQCTSHADLASQHPPKRYTFTKVATLNVAPNLGDFEVGQINNRGDLIFVSETETCLDTGLGFSLCEGVFLVRRGQLSEIIGTSDPVPGGGIFAGFVVGPTAMNEAGDAALPLGLAPFALPFGLNSGLYRYTGGAGTLSAVVVPGVTVAPGTGGSTFQGIFFGTSINNLGTIAFPGVIPASGIPAGKSYGVGVFTADLSGTISKVVIPGDAAPGGMTFDFARNTSINGGGDVAFEGHLAEAECGGPFDYGCFEATGVYLRQAASGSIIKIAQQGDLDPLGTPFRHCWGPVVNDAGHVVFVGDLTPPPDFDQAQGLYLYSGSSIVPIVRPGDTLPGGGTLKTVANAIGNYGLNNRGDVSFTGFLENGDSGFYMNSGGVLRLVAKTGTVIPGIGTFSAPGTSGLSGPVINDRGQVFLVAILTGGDTVLLTATPTP